MTVNTRIQTAAAVASSKEIDLSRRRIYIGFFLLLLLFGTLLEDRRRAAAAAVCFIGGKSALQLRGR